MSEITHEVKPSVIPQESYLSARQQLVELKKSGTDPHFDLIELSDLGVDEFELFDKFLQGTITEGDINTYRHESIDSHNALADDRARDSKENLLAYILNKQIGRMVH